ncbi:MAG: hypothetical protein IPF60_17065 [Betaproteobacteria bacterium]|nr:hypothetical protein [Betaproteobacteria bacterium]
MFENRLLPDWLALVARPLTIVGDTMKCPNPPCGIAYPIVNGRPILVNEKNSIFSFSDYTARRVTTMDLELDTERQRPLRYRIRGFLSRLMPNPSLCSTDYPLEKILEHISEGFDGNAKLLVIGAGEQAVDFSRGGKVLYTDVAIGNLTNMVCDAHDLPLWTPASMPSSPMRCSSTLRKAAHLGPADRLPDQVF